MILDSHVHLKHGDAAGTEYDADTIVAVMDSAGIDRSVVFAIHCDSQTSLAMATSAVARHPGRLVAYLHIDPTYDRRWLALTARAVSDRVVRGLKLHYGYRVPELAEVEPFVRLAGELGIPCLVDFAGRLEACETIARACPQTTILVAHLGRYLCRDAALIDSFVAAAETHANLFLDASGVVLGEKIADAVRRVGAARVLFGTDGPHPRPTLEEMATGAIAQIRGLGLSAADEAMVLGGAAARLLGLPEGVA